MWIGRLRLPDSNRDATSRLSSRICFEAAIQSRLEALSLPQAGTFALNSLHQPSFCHAAKDALGPSQIDVVRI